MRRCRCRCPRPGPRFERRGLLTGDDRGWCGEYVQPLRVEGEGATEAAFGEAGEEGDGATGVGGDVPVGEAGVCLAGRFGEQLADLDGIVGGGIPPPGPGVEVTVGGCGLVQRGGEGGGVPTGEPGADLVGDRGGQDAFDEFAVVTFVGGAQQPAVTVADRFQRGVREVDQMDGEWEPLGEGAQVGEAEHTGSAQGEFRGDGRMRGVQHPEGEQDGVAAAAGGSGAGEPAATLGGGADRGVEVTEGVADAEPADEVGPAGVQGGVGAAPGGGHGQDHLGGNAVGERVRGHPQPGQIGVGERRVLPQVGAGEVGVERQRKVRVVQRVQAGFAIAETASRAVSAAVSRTGWVPGGGAGDEGAHAEGDAEEHVGVEPMVRGDTPDGGELPAGRPTVGVPGDRVQRGEQQGGRRGRQDGCRPGQAAQVVDDPGGAAAAVLPGEGGGRWGVLRPHAGCSGQAEGSVVGRGGADPPGPGAGPRSTSMGKVPLPAGAVLVVEETVIPPAESGTVGVQRKIPAGRAVVGAAHGNPSGRVAAASARSRARRWARIHAAAASSAGSGSPQLRTSSQPSRCSRISKTVLIVRSATTPLCASWPMILEAVGAPAR
ncbi:hypothetical protein Francci3_3301 [Frankia casuarinae]|uniref:Uncharacterized protein n=1 Tax=Frankia casuarinae (strain DSM 45818 / CECT 9043 / HFP020203 / CcI3) TaxID=106370 RepID=Q2J7T4_FRACC|nr:hypothetical protein Francci3_3301 [Frankia casuarinae]